MKPSSFVNLSRSLFPVFATATLFASPLAHGSTVFWNGDTSAAWNAANWSGGGTPPVNGDSLVFGAPGYGGTTLSNDITSLIVGGHGTDGISFSVSAGAYTISRPGSQTLTLGSSAGGLAILDLSLFAQTITAPFYYSGDQTIQVGGATGPALASLILSGAQTGGFRLTKTGNGLLTLNGSNTFEGLTVNAGVVSVNSDVALGAVPGTAMAGLLILNGGALQTNAASLTINAKRGIALGGAAAGSGGTISVAQGTTVYNGAIANNGGANSLIKAGGGALSLGAASSYTGATIINQGQLTLDFSASGAPTSDIINAGSKLGMGGFPTALGNTAAANPILFIQGSNTAATSQTFDGLTLNPGASNIVARGGSSTFDTIVNVGAITRNPGGTVGFTLLKGSSTGQGRITTTTANTNGILGGWATTTGVGTGTAPLGQTDWAANDGNGNIVAYTGYTVVGTAPGYGTTTAATIASDAPKNLKIDSTSTGDVTVAVGTTNANSIQYSGATARNIVINGAGTLRLGSSGGILRAGTALLTIKGGTLTAGDAPNTAGQIVFNTGSGANWLTGINSVSKIVDNGSGAVTVIKTGDTALSLGNSSNTYSGGTFVNQGTINAIFGGCFGTGDVTVLSGASVNFGGDCANNFIIAGSALKLDGRTLSGLITLQGDATISSNSIQGGILTGKITGDYSLTFSSGTYLVSNTGNDYSGNLTVAAAASGTANVLQFGDNNVLSHGAGKGNVIITGDANATNLSFLDLNGKSQTINGLISAGASAQVLVTNNAATASTLTLGDNDQSATFGGAIVDGTNGGTVAIAKVGAGVQTLSGINTYTGSTTVSAGQLNVNGSLAAGSAVYVNSGATLGGSGTVNGPTNVTGGTVNGSGLSINGLTAFNGNGNSLKGNVKGDIAVASSSGLLLSGTLTGNATISGTMQAQGMVSGRVTVANGGKLGGGGTVGSVTVQSGGTLAPGDRAVTNVTSDVFLQAGSSASFVLNGTSGPVTQGVDYDQVSLGGNLSIGTGVTLMLNASLSQGASLYLSLNPSDPTHTNVTLQNYFVFNLANNSASVTGRFDQLSDGLGHTAMIDYSGNNPFSGSNGIGYASLNGMQYAISYSGNFATNSTLGGNDIVVTLVPEPQAWTMLIGAATMLVCASRLPQRRSTRSSRL